MIEQLGVLISMAYYTLLERKVLSYIQTRKGPNKVGIVQPIADAIKLFIKNQLNPVMINMYMFYISPLFALGLSLIMWVLAPHNSVILGLLVFLCISSIGVYSTLLAGWSSNSKYALLGSIRAIAQTISYEVAMSFILLSPVIIFKSFNFFYINCTYPVFIFMPLVCLIWLISIHAELHRAPFDFVEGESELVSGYNVEYSGGGFAMLFMSEYVNILFMSMLTCIFFFFNNIILIAFLSLFFLASRGSLPRLRYDMLMVVMWKNILPFSLSYFWFIFLFMKLLL